MFQSESTLYSCLNVKELLARNKCDILSLSDSSRIRIHNHLVCKQTLNHLAKLAKELLDIQAISTNNTAQSLRPVWLNH